MQTFPSNRIGKVEKFFIQSVPLYLDRKDVTYIYSNPCIRGRRHGGQARQGEVLDYDWFHAFSAWFL